MSAQVQAPPAAAPRSRSRTRRLLLLLPALLVVAVAVNGSTLLKIVKGEKSLKGVIYGITEKTGVSIHGWRMPADTGAEDAKVTIEVFLAPGDSCHTQTLLLGRSLTRLDPARVRVEFVADRERLEKVRLGCDQGLAVNGKTRLTVAKAEGQKPETLYMSHDGGGMAPEKLYLLINSELKAAYKGKGLAMDATQFTTYIEAEKKRFMEIELAYARARQELRPDTAAPQPGEAMFMPPKSRSASPPVPAPAPGK